MAVGQWDDKVDKQRCSKETLEAAVVLVHVVVVVFVVDDSSEAVVEAVSAVGVVCFETAEFRSVWMTDLYWPFLLRTSDVAVGINVVAATVAVVGGSCSEHEEFQSQNMPEWD